MRKQTKVLVAAALFTLGASFSALAAKTGTWVLEDAGWMCYDKDGDEYTDEFCLSYGKEYYVGDDGVLVTSAWVEGDDNDMFYVGSDGSKTISDWRLVAPADDEEADEEWFYFDTKGKMVRGKKVIDTKTYYFDTDGKMLTGWVSYNSDSKVAQNVDTYTAGMTFCAEDGARVSADWVQTWAPEVTEDEQEDTSMVWYYVKSNGALQTKKAVDIEGRAYLFDDECKMITGWAELLPDGTYEAERTGIVAGGTFYFCDETDGDVKKSRWVKTWAPEEYTDKDADDSQYWYYIGKDGKVYVPELGSATSAKAITFVEGEGRDFDEATGSNAFFKTIDSKTYAFKSNGQMWSGLMETAGNMYYLGESNDGSMKTGAVVIADQDDYEYKFYFGDKDTKYAEVTASNAACDPNYTKGVAVTGAAGGYLYENGLLVKATAAKYELKTVEIDGVEVEFIVNANGSIQTSAKEYKEDGTVVVNAKADDVTFFTSKNDGLFKGAVKTGTVTKNY